MVSFKLLVFAASKFHFAFPVLNATLLSCVSFVKSASCLRPHRRTKRNICILFLGSFTTISSSLIKKIARADAWLTVKSFVNSPATRQWEREPYHQRTQLGLPSLKVLSVYAARPQPVKCWLD